MPNGTLFVISAPSGAGKTSLVRGLQSSLEGLAVSVSHTTRRQRAGEENGRDYFFVDRATFERMAATNAFLEYAEVFDHYYGTARCTVAEKLAAGCDVVLEIDWQGARQVRRSQPDCVSIFVLPPSRRALEERLTRRAQDSAATIARRMRDAISEMSHYDEYDYLIINNQFDTALEELRSIVVATRLRTALQVIKHQELLSGLTQGGTAGGASGREASGP